MTSATWTPAHKAGEIWANMLYEMYWNLMAKTGKFNPDWYSADLTSGNTLSLALVVKAMMLQPCNPSFVQGRDAILQADQVLTGGQNTCPIWRAFAKRGLGQNAVVAPVASDFMVPSGC
jgi:extracellular elastinolytic metalloproteinase